jgi:hypothetical protein
MKYNWIVMISWNFKNENVKKKKNIKTQQIIYQKVHWIIFSFENQKKKTYFQFYKELTVLN